jgi:hypothetical protein
MAPRLLTILALAAAAATPALAQESGGRRRPENRTNQEQGARAPERAERRERAVPRSDASRNARPETRQVRPETRTLPAQPPPQVRRDTGRSDRDRDNGRGWNNGRSGNGRYDGRRYDNNGRYDNRRPDYNRAVPRRYTPRIVRPVVVRVIPYRPYVYRPSYSRGVYYGSNGYYPYGYTPRGYFDPIPGRPYGGLRITDAPRYARVFADGYYVGLVNDFDGIFQHLNLEAGPHRIEIEDEGYGAIGFDVYIRPGQTITYRAGF